MGKRFLKIIITDRNKVRNTDRQEDWEKEKKDRKQTEILADTTKKG